MITNLAKSKFRRKKTLIYSKNVKIIIKVIINMLLNMVILKNCGLMMTFEVLIHYFPQKNTMKKFK